MSKLDFAAKVLPSGYQIVSNEAITWLYENYPEVYKGFYERVDGYKTSEPEHKCDFSKGMYCSCGKSVF